MSDEPTEMPAYLRDVLHQQAAAMAHLWYWAHELNKLPLGVTVMWVYGKHVDSRKMIAKGQRIKITIELEGE